MSPRMIMPVTLDMPTVAGHEVSLALPFDMRVRQVDSHDGSFWRMHVDLPLLTPDRPNLVMHRFVCVKAMDEIPHGADADYLATQRGKGGDYYLFKYKEVYPYDAQQAT